MTIAVSGLAMTPVKGMRVSAPGQVLLDSRGVSGDRLFLVVDAENKLLLTRRAPKLLEVEAAWDGTDSVLTLRFPDGTVVKDQPPLGAPVRTTMYDGRVLCGHRVDGVLAEAVSEHLGRPVRLLRRAPDETGTDDAHVTLMSESSLRALAPELDGAVPDPRRFRMTMTVSGTEAWAEHGWAGREVAVGSALLRAGAPVPRCVVTTRNPESGRTDAPVLHALARLRGKSDLTLGIWCDVVSPGTVSVGDQVSAT